MPNVNNNQLHSFFSSNPTTHSFYPILKHYKMRSSAIVPMAMLPYLGSAQFPPTSKCTPDSFTFPDLFGSELVSISANSAVNYTTVSLAPGSSERPRYTIDFCNVTVTYTHPGWGDTINVQVWLPSKSWTGRLQALGGGGYSASFGPLYLTQAVAAGDVAIGTDAGHVQGNEAAQSPGPWALSSPGNLNLNLFRDWASRSLHDMAVIGKAITEDFFGSQPDHSYFSGCSGGGRQALMIAQKYPEDFDGILAAAPAINIANFIPAGFWAQQVMKNIGTVPPPCEIQAFTQAAIDACDSLDGVVDNVIASPLLCKFAASDVVGQSFDCDGTSREFTAAGAQIVQAAWDGARTESGKVGWFGLNKDADLSSVPLVTECQSNGTCVATGADLFTGWFQYFLAKDPDFDASLMTDDEFFAYLAQSEKEFGAEADAADPDLSLFRAAGGKLITWHGLADEAIPPNGTIAYYQQVLELDPAAGDFARFFEAPGAAHCYGGQGPTPNGAFSQLVAWVEDGTVPETLVAVDTKGNTRGLCPFPTVQKYIGGNTTDPVYQCSSPDVDPGNLAEEFPLFS